MNNNLEFWKGSSGYSAPGCTGARGEDGNSIHFSSIDASVNDSSISERIEENKCLSDNPNVNSFESYKDQDYILDIYGDLYLLTGIDEHDPELSYTGNIFFHPEDTRYHAATDSSGNCVLNFETDQDIKYLQNGDYVKHKNSDQSYPSILWHHRWNDCVYAQNMPCIKISPSTHDASLSYYDSSVPYTSEQFISHISEVEVYHKICAVMNNGIVIEKITSPDDTDMIIELGYANMIDNNLTGNNSPYTSFDNEKKISYKINTYRPMFRSNSNNRICNMYFEYSHENEIYRMKINVD